MGENAAAAATPTAVGPAREPFQAYVCMRRDVGHSPLDHLGRRRPRGPVVVAPPKVL